MVLKEKDYVNFKQNETILSFQSLVFNEKLLFQFMDLLPITVEVFYPDGTAAFVNKALLKELGIASADSIIGKYNVLNDSVIGCGLREYVLRALQGEIATVHDAKVPLNCIIQKYNIRDLEIESIYYDITTFPIKDGDNNILYVACVFFTRRSYRGRQDILKAKEYIKNHLLEKFDIKQVAKTVNLSSYHFARLFKKHVGQTPYNYYLDLKFDLLKEKLLDPNLTVAQAFEASALSYNGYFAKMFRKKFGVNPVQFRQLERDKNDEFRML